MALKRQGNSDTSSQEVETVKPTAVERFATYMKQRAVVDAEDNSGLGMAPIMERILNADTEEEIWDADEGSGIPDGKAMVGIEQRITSVDVMDSKNTEISNADLGNTFLYVHCQRLSNGEEITWNTSAPLLVTKLMRFAAKGYFLDGKSLDCVVQATDLGGGKTVLKLRPVQTRAI